MRRARRLLPALFLMMSLLMVYSAIFERDTLGKLRGDVIAGVAYVTNWYQIWTGAGYTALLDFAPLRHLWSLAVEEQFYLIWPLVMVALMRLGRRRLPEISRWLVLAALLIAVITGLLYHPGQLGTPEVAPEAFWSVGGHPVSKMDALYLSTFTRATGLLLGAALAMIWRPVAVMRGPMRDKGPLLDVLAVLGLGALGALAWFLHVQVDGHADPWLFRGGFLATDFATLLVIVAVTHRGAKMGMFLGAQPLNWIGTRSYGLYLYHWPIFQIIRGNAGATLTVPEFVGAMVVTCIITELSYRYVEMPIRRRQLGKWLGPGPRRRRPTAAPGARRRRRRLRRRVRLRRGQHVHRPAQAERGAGDDRRRAKRTSPTSERCWRARRPPLRRRRRRQRRRRPPRQRGADPTTAPTTTVAATTTAPQAIGRYLAIGDSVMAGAASPAEGSRVHRRRCREPPVRRLPAAVAGHRRQRSGARRRGRPPRHQRRHRRETTPASSSPLLADVPKVIVLRNWVDRPWTVATTS